MDLEAVDARVPVHDNPEDEVVDGNATIQGGVVVQVCDLDYEVGWSRRCTFAR